MNAGVVVHRWFERGAGWAYAPEVEPHRLAIIAVLDQHLKAAKTTTFQVPVGRDMFLVGTVAPDPDCADPKARNRRPTILRAVLLPGRPHVGQHMTPPEPLERVWPKRPGPDPTLVIPVTEALYGQRPVRGIQEEDTIGVRGTRGRARNMLYMMLPILAVGAVLGGLSLVGPASKPSNSGAAFDSRAVATMMAKQLAGWGLSVGGRGGMEPDEVFSVYYKFLSQAEVGEMGRAGGHPYLRFVKRLPRQPEMPNGGRWTEGEVVSALRAIVASLDPEDPPPETLTVADSIARISRLMDYELWRNGSHKLDPDGAFADAPDDGVARYVERFRRAGGSIPDLVPKMRECLLHWKLTDVEGAPDFTVVRLFFNTLNRPSERLEGLTDTDMRHAYWKFMSRLPDVSCIAWTGDTDEEVEDGIARIAVALGRTVAIRLVASWVDAIRMEMDYDAWLANLTEQDRKGMITRDEPACPKLRTLVARFRSAKDVVRVK